MRHQSGFAIVTAIFTSMLIAGVMLAMMITLSADVRRTMKLRDEAQVQQLLLASQRMAVASLEAQTLTDRGTTTLPLPTEFSEIANVALFGEMISTDLATVRVDVRFDQLIRRQRLKFVRDSDKWTLQSATLDDY